jgi:hypothetical protein
MTMLLISFVSLTCHLIFMVSPTLKVCPAVGCSTTRESVLALGPVFEDLLQAHPARRKQIIAEAAQWTTKFFFMVSSPVYFNIISNTKV